MSNSKPAGHDTADGEAEIEHQANTNQVRHEPVPASHDDERRPAAVVRNEESAARSAATGTGQRDARQRDELRGDQEGNGRDHDSG